MQLASYYFINRRLRIQSETVPAHIKETTCACFHTTGISDMDLTACSLHAGGAMAFLCRHCDSDTIELLGQRHSDTMMQYFHPRSSTSFVATCQEDV